MRNFSSGVIGCAVVLLGACKSAPATSEEASPAFAIPVAAAMVPAPAAPVAVRRSDFEISIASFRDEKLDECVDYTITPTPGQEAVALEAMTKLTDLKGTDKGQTALRIAKHCEDQFADRTVLATCAIDEARKLGRLTLKSHYYSLSTVESDDSYMRGCLSMKGDWQTNTNKGAVAIERRRDKRKQLEQMIADAEQE